MKKVIFLLLINAFATLNLFSQYYFYVFTSNEKVKPSLKSKAASNDEALNQIFKEFGVTNYRQAFPGAKNVELQNFYEIHLEDNKNERSVNSFESSLKNNKVFDEVYRCDYYEPACDKPLMINDPCFVNNRVNTDALDLLNAHCAWKITTGDPNIIVGVIDTEFEANHEDLINTFESIVGSRTHNQNHSTAVSSCIATGVNNNIGIAGIGYNTRIRGYHSNGINLWTNIWQAYQDGIKIINVSWTGIGSYPTVLAVQEMTDNGVVLVVAAGNQPTATDHRLYADIPGVINVSGVDANNYHAPTNHAHNQWVDVCAMSRNVAACWPGNGYIGTANGTSFAAPQVAGVVALIRSINNNLSPAEIENIIKATADPVADVHLYPGQLGTGRVNAYKALQATCATTSSVVNFTNQDVNSNRGINSCGDINVQNVKVQNNAKLILNAAENTIIGSNFEVVIGSQLEIK